jgi:hypothetical protein
MFRSQEEGAVWSPKSQSPPEMEMLAMERMKKTGEDLGLEARCVWKPPMIRMDEIERRHRKRNDLKRKWIYRK